MQEPISVSTLNNQIKSLLETHYSSLLVKGEVSRVTYHTSGHIYFNLKDENSTINCVMFKANNKNLKFKIQEGMSIICFCTLSVFTPRGSYQLNILTVEPEGSGALALAFKQLKEKLSQKGYFDPKNKKPLPTYPKTIALVTSKTGAALQDMLRVAKKRYPLVKFILIDTQVQGEGSASMIAKNIKFADTLKCDIIIVARGGGSQEDLWSFNEEIVADAIYCAKTPIISAIGHEIDTVISDLVADKRASTPSNAIEIALPDKTELLILIDHLLNSYIKIYSHRLENKKRELSHLKALFLQNSYLQKIKNQKEMLSAIKTNLKTAMQFNLTKKKNLLNTLKENYSQNDPKNQVKKGFAQIVKDGQKVELCQLKSGDIFEATDATTTVRAKVL